MEPIWIIFIWVINGVYGCSWDTFTLNPLSGLLIQCQYSIWGLEYTPCQNKIACENATSGEQPNGMVIQYKIEDGQCAAHTAEWDNGATIPIEFVNETTGHAYKYMFNYTNGWDQNGCSQEIYGGRKTIITFHCDPDADPYSDVTCDEGSDDTRCTYYLDIHTHLACVDADLSHLGQQDKGLSGGSIVIIIFISFLFVYCVIGYSINGYKSKQMSDFKNNIPNGHFWGQLPRFVKAGCDLTFEAIGGMCCEAKHDRVEALVKK